MIKSTLLFWLISVAAIGQSMTWQPWEVTDSTSRGAIRGTLLVPSIAEPVPVVLMIAGSGPTDRDGNSIGAITSNCTKMMAEQLASNKIASLRYDKRGIGKSVRVIEADLRFDDYIKDAADWIAWLRKDKRFSKIIILGHSEGSLIGMAAAGGTGGDGFISLAGAGRPIDVVLNEQVKRNANNPESVKNEVFSILTELKMGNTVPTVPPYLNALFRPSVQPYLINWLQYDPASEIAKLKCPVMIIQGTTDIQVAMSDAHALHSACPKATYEVIEGMNHILKDAPSDLTANAATYANPNLPLSVPLVPAIVRFIGK